MATLEQEMQEREKLHSILDELATVNPEKLIRLDELGSTLSFEAGLPYFDRTLRLFRTLAESNLDNVPYSVLNRLSTQATEVKNQIDQVRSFSPTDSNPVSTRDSIINSFRDNYDKRFTEISPVIAYSIRKGTDFELLEREARETVIQSKAMAQEIRKNGEQASAEAESTLEKIKQAAAEVGVAQHATHFKIESDYHSKTAINWLIATAIIGILTIVWGVFSFKFHAIPVSNPPQTIELVESFASKIIVLSVLYYTLVWSAKNYNAHRHNFVVNKHRQNALSTFETFVKAANDSDTKNAVLIQATQSIFGAQQSGYIQKDSEQESPNKIIEIMRSVSSMSKGN
jgi:hypothetical protein